MHGPIILHTMLASMHSTNINALKGTTYIYIYIYIYIYMKPLLSENQFEIIKPNITEGFSLPCLVASTTYDAQ